MQNFSWNVTAVLRFRPCHYWGFEITRRHTTLVYSDFGRWLSSLRKLINKTLETHNHKYRVIHKSVKHFKNSQQIDYSTDHGSSYADRERNSPSFFLYISQMLNLSTFGNTADIYAIVHLVPTRVSAYHGRPEPQQRWYGCEDPGDWLGVEAQRQCPSQTPIRKSRTGLNPGTGVATTLTRHLLVLYVVQNTKWLLTFTERHICYYCLLAANQGNIVHGLFLKKTSTVSLSIDVRITMISGVVYLLRIFKMFHELMNNPV